MDPDPVHYAAQQELAQQGIKLKNVNVQGTTLLSQIFKYPLTFLYVKKVLTYQNKIEEMEDTEVTKKIYNYVIQRDENFGYNRMIATIQKTQNG